MTADDASLPPAPFAAKAIFFDFGGVILSSPLDAFHAFEAQAALPRGFLANLNTQNPDTNAWACMERGEIDEAEFYARFEAEARALSPAHSFDARKALAMLTGHVRQEMVDVVRNVRTRYRTACLTNNMRLGLGTAMASTPALAAEIADVMTLFEHVVESSKIGARKPEMRFFETACAVVGVAPGDCVFLDDLGTNLKPAKAMGMKTIKVTSAAQAMDDLEALLGHSVR